MAIISKSHVLDLEESSSQYASIAHASQTGLSFNSSFSAMCWVLSESFPGNNARHTLISKYDSANAGYEVNIFRTAGAVLQLEVRIRQNGSTEDVKVQNASTVGFNPAVTWQHVAITANYSGGALSLKMYVDGIDRVGAISGTTTAVGTNSKEFAIGARSDGAANFYDGLISDVKVFNTALTQSEVVAHMRHYRNVDTSMGQWRFNGNYTDASPNGNTLTAVGSPSFNTTNLPFPTYGRTTRFFVGPGDGNVSNVNGASWDAAHDATAGTIADSSAVTTIVETSKPFSSSLRTIRRVFLPIDTSGFDGNVQIIGASLGIIMTALSHHSVAEGAVNAGIGVVQTSQASDITLATDDFDQCGSIDDPPEGATRVVVWNGSSDQVVISIVTWINLNSTGVGWINLGGYTHLGLRGGRDLDDLTYSSSATQVDSVTINSSEATGTVNDPFIDILDDDEFYGGTTGEGGISTTGAFGGVNLGGGSGAAPGEYIEPSGGGDVGGIGGPGEAGASSTNTVGLAGIFFVE